MNSQLATVSLVANSRMANVSPTFERCPGDSPACLGMVEYNCCGTVDQDGRASDMEDCVMDNSKRKKLSLKRSKKAKLPLWPSTHFKTTVI